MENLFLIATHAQILKKLITQSDYRLRFVELEKQIDLSLNSSPLHKTKVSQAILDEIASKAAASLQKHNQKERENAES